MCICCPSWATRLNETVAWYRLRIPMAPALSKASRTLPELDSPCGLAPTIRGMRPARSLGDCNPAIVLNWLRLSESSWRTVGGTSTYAVTMSTSLSWGLIFCCGSRGLAPKSQDPNTTAINGNNLEKRVLQIGTAKVTLQWVKGHATEQMVENGQCTRQDKVGNDGADALAVQGRQIHPIEEGVMHGIHLRRRVTMAIQTFMIITAMARSRRRQELEEERALEELENADPNQEK